MAEKLSYAAYKARWADPYYKPIVEYRAKELKSDGCTLVSEFYHYGCLEHDIAYRTGLDPFGEEITRNEADKRFRWYHQMKTPYRLGVFNPVGWYRWFMVRLTGRAAWKGPEDRAD